MTDQSATPGATTSLRQRMIEDMAARLLKPGTQRGYIRGCKRFAAFLERSPETATAEDIRLFQLHLIESGTSICSRNQMMKASPTPAQNSSQPSPWPASEKPSQNRPEIEVIQATSAFFGCGHSAWSRWRPRCRYTVSCLDGLVVTFMIVQPVKGAFPLHPLRAIFAILIALSLTFAPITSASAAMQMRASMEGAAAQASSLSHEAMSDCMKAMQVNGQVQDQNCPCCDTPSKSMCPDVGACLAKCSFHVIAIFSPALDSGLPAIRHNRPADPQEPPDWAFVPPAPPPRT